MPPKAKKAVTKVKPSSSPTAQQSINQSINQLTLRHSRHTETLLSTTPLRRDFVHLSIHLLDCPYVSNDWVVNQSTNLQSIIDRLEREHGYMKPIRLYRVPACPENELVDRSLSLADLGCVPGRLIDSPEAPIIRYDIIYDFLPNTGSPILMREPDLRNVQINQSINGSVNQAEAETEFEHQHSEAISMLPYVQIPQSVNQSLNQSISQKDFHGQPFHSDDGRLIDSIDNSLFSTPVGAAKQFASQFA